MLQGRLQSLQPYASPLLKIGAVLVAILVLWNVYTLLDNDLTTTHNLPTVQGEFNGTADCETTSTGWKCSFDVPKDQRQTGDIPIQQAFIERCRDQGGAFVCYGFCAAGYDHFCDFTFKDAGQPCIGSWQCGGKCTTSRDATTPAIGTCSERAVRTCDSPITVRFGIVHARQVLCE
jgi:hypothetical protein